MYIPAKPALLKPGSKIKIVAPSGIITRNYIKRAKELLSAWGLNIALGKNLFAEHNQFAGTDEQRLSDFQEALDDDSVDAILCARGGYGLIRIIDKLNWENFKARPKWIAGFSDITVLHSALTRSGFQSLHSPMPINMEAMEADSRALRMLHNAFFKGSLEYSLTVCSKNIHGEAAGILTGGNLSLLYALMGTPFDIDTNGKILFIEDIGEQLYHLDRMLQAMRLAGKFKNLKGLIVGGFTEMEDKKRPFGKTVEEIILSVIGSLSIPVIFNFPAGHIRQNYPLILGSETRISANDEFVKICML